MIICIVGPTGVGKTNLSIELAKKYNSIIINCDSMQIYKDLNIGTAKIKEEEKENIPHYLFDIKNVEEEYSVYDYQKDLRNILDNNKDKNIIIVGGTGLYLKAGLYDYSFEEEISTNEYDELTNDELYDLCIKKDPDMPIHINNRKRLVRLLNKKNIEVNNPVKLYNHIIVGLTTTREILYDKINKRVDQMINEGLVEEVKYFHDRNIRCKPLSAGIGYKELYEYFDKKITYEEAIELIKKNSRHYAKRQYTFFNNQFDVKWFNTNYTDFGKTIKEVIEYIEKES